MKHVVSVPHCAPQRGSRAWIRRMRRQTRMQNRRAQLHSQDEQDGKAKA
jgi:hypothetical protein